MTDVDARLPVVVAVALQLYRGTVLRHARCALHRLQRMMVNATHYEAAVAREEHLHVVVRSQTHTKLSHRRPLVVWRRRRVIGMIVAERGHKIFEVEDIVTVFLKPCRRSVPS